jgi:hypothetical protein
MLTPPYERLGKIHQMLDPTGNSCKSIEELISELLAEVEAGRKQKAFITPAMRETAINRMREDR